MTQFGRALAELNIEILCANSSQAKGRVRKGQSDASGQACEGTAPRRHIGHRSGQCVPAGVYVHFNQRFAKVPTRPDDLHRALNVAPDRLRDVLCKREQRYVGQQLSFSYERGKSCLRRTSFRAAWSASTSISTSSPTVGWTSDGERVPYLTPSLTKQRVTHTAITENKRLGEVLTWIKAQQDEARPPPKIRTNSEQSAYKKRGTKPGRRTNFMNDPAVIARRDRLWQVWPRPSEAALKAKTTELPGSHPIGLRNPDQLSPDRALTSASGRASLSHF